MTRGCVLFAHNSRQVDYALLSVISGGLAAKNLQLPVTLITDESTMAWMAESHILNKAKSIFDHIIAMPRPDRNNHRLLHDGAASASVPFFNQSRADVFDLTPYDETLLIDSDFLIFTDRLNQYWCQDHSVSIASSVKDVASDRIGLHDIYVSDTGIRMSWATTVMFKKNPQSQLFFNTVDTVRKNYGRFADIYRFDRRIFRNDIAFSVAKHMLDGFQLDISSDLPPVFSTFDKDMLHQVSANGTLTFLVNQPLTNDYCLAATTAVDIHVMNKQSLVRNAASLMELL